MTLINNQHPDQDRVVAAHVCNKLKRSDIKIGLGLVDRYRGRIEEAKVLYGAEYGEAVSDPIYIAQVVVDEFREEANTRFGPNLKPVSVEPIDLIDQAA